MYFGKRTLNRKTGEEEFFLKYVPVKDISKEKLGKLYRGKCKRKEWMNLQTVMQSEINQTQKDKHHLVSLT